MVGHDGISGFDVGIEGMPGISGPGTGIPIDGISGLEPGEGSGEDGMLGIPGISPPIPAGPMAVTWGAMAAGEDVVMVFPEIGC